MFFEETLPEKNQKNHLEAWIEPSQRSNMGCFALYLTKIFHKNYLQEKDNFRFTRTIQKQSSEAVLTNFVIFSGKHLCWSLLLIKT